MDLMVVVDKNWAKPLYCMTSLFVEEELKEYMIVIENENFVHDFDCNIN